MRGSPVIRGLAVVAVLLLLLVPILSMTRPSTSDSPLAPAPQPRPMTAPLTVQLTSSAVPFTFSVSHLGTIVWEGEATHPRIEKEVSLPFPTEGIDLLVTAHWQTSAPAALEIHVSREGEEIAPQTVWGEQTVTEVLTFR